MTIDEAVRTYLMTQTAVTAKVGTSPSSRIYPVEAPAGAALPYIVYGVIGRNEGRIQEVKNYRQYYQFSCYSSTGYSDAMAIAEAVADAFYHKPNAGYTGIHLISAALAGVRALPYDQETKVYGAVADVVLEYIKTA